MNDKIYAKLIDQGYPEKVASIAVAELSQLHPQLQPLLEGWLNEAEEDFEVQGFNIFGLMKTRKMKYLAALLTIDWLLKEPEKAVESLKNGIK